MRIRLLVVLVVVCASVFVYAPALADITVDTSIGATLPYENGNIELAGLASPGALVTFLNGSNVIGTQVAATDGSFDDTFTAQTPGATTYSVYDTDTSGRNSAQVTINVTITAGSTTTISGILLPTTLQVAQATIKRPQTQTITGTTCPNCTITTIFDGARDGDTFSTTASSDSNGNWTSATGPLAHTLHLGSYTVSAIVNTAGGSQSPQTPNASFQVLLSADLNSDGRVDLTDFSILMYYFGRNNINVPADINDDGNVNLTDFSIMLYYWTG